MAFNAKDSATQLDVPFKTTVDLNGQVASHHHVDSSALPNNAATASNQSAAQSSLTSMLVALQSPQPAGTNILGKVDHSTSGIGHGVKTVATAGTDVVLAASTPAKWATVQAQTDNTGWVAVGAAGVDATISTGTGVMLAAGESMTIPCDNLADIFIDATVSTDGVRFVYGT